MKETNDFTEEIRFLLSMPFKVRFAQSGSPPHLSQLDFIIKYNIAVI